MSSDGLKNRLLNEREQSVLRALVYDYISTGKPVGSRSFVQKYSFSISPATMRNIMADLENMGYVHQPHTSSGRVPTDLGYRYYVDSLLEKYRSFTGSVEVNEDVLEREVQFDKLFSSITRNLSQASRYAGFMLTPSPYFTVVKRIELIPLDANEVLVIIVARTGMVFTRKVRISSSLTHESIYEYSRYLNSELCGYSVQDIKERVIGQLRKNASNSWREMALDIVELSLNSGENASRLQVDGLENLLKLHEMSEEKHLNSLLGIMEEKSILRCIVERSMPAEGIRTIIGSEIGNENVHGCSIVTAAYKIGNRRVGAVGILGPTRMDYEKVVPLVDYTGRVVSELLTKMSK